MARSRSGGRAGGRASAAPQSTPPTDEASPAISLASATLPRVWRGVGYRPLADVTRARSLFDFAAIRWPEQVAFAWGAWRAGDDGEQLIGAIAAERHRTAAMLHGPVIDTRVERASPGDPLDPLETAAQLVAAAMDHASALGAATLYTRPHGLDRVWVRFGFIPVPEVALPPALAGRPGAGLYAWRGGTALWTLREAAEG